MLHITDGASVSLRNTRLGGTVIYWNDVLHEGPVPAGMSLDELTRVRERFIAAYFGLRQGEVSFAERNAAMRGCANEDEVILWFEHDLYDQLQLIQILDWLSREAARPARLSIIHTDRYLGWHTANELEARFETRVPVSDEHFEIAQAGLESVPCAGTGGHRAAGSRDEWCAALSRRSAGKAPATISSVKQWRLADRASDSGVDRFRPA
jgi:hypothetical protein